MKFEWLSAQAVEFIDTLLSKQLSTDIAANRIAVDVLRRLGVCEREEAIQYLARVAPDVLSAIRQAYPHYT